MEQLDILKHARSTDPQTSKDAAASVKLGSQCQNVLGAFDCFPDGATSGELCSWLERWFLRPFQQSVIARRLTDLEELGLIERTGETRKGPSGRQLTVWRAL